MFHILYSLILMPADNYSMISVVVSQFIKIYCQIKEIKHDNQIQQLRKIKVLEILKLLQYDFIQISKWANWAREQCLRINDCLT